MNIPVPFLEHIGKCSFLEGWPQRMATHLSPQPASPRGDNVSEVSFQVPETYGSWQPEILRSPVDI